jgi:hypothetical protein
MTIDLKELEFLLSHFEPPAFPRRFSTFATENKQYRAYSLQYMLDEFKRAKDIDCAVNAYGYLGRTTTTTGPAGNNNGNGHSKVNPFDYDHNKQLTREDVAYQIQQRALQESAPTILDIDIDRKNFPSDRTYNNAINRTIKKVYDTFLISKGVEPLSTLFTGGGHHILIPLETDPAKYPVKNNMTINHVIPGRDINGASLFTWSDDYRFSASHRLPANQFLRFAERYLSNGLSDNGHNLSVRSDMVRVPGSYNSKYEETDDSEVKFVRRWDGKTKAHMIFLLGRFYRDVQDSLQKQAKKCAKVRKIRYKAQIAPILAIDNTLRKIPVSGTVASGVFGESAYSEYAHSKYWYIDRLLQKPIDDYRKQSIDLLLAPYLITVKGMSDIVAERIMTNWALRCNMFATLDFDPAERIRSKIYEMRTALQVSSTGFLPISEEKLHAEHPEWYVKIIGVNPPPPSCN